jgi:hypothetical protein
MAWRVAGAVAALLFLWAASVQLNDPDPLVWIGVYVVAAALSALTPWGRLPWWVSAAWAAPVGGWSLWLAARVLGQQPLFDSEEGREMMGLAILALWALAQAAVARKRRVS